MASILLVEDSTDIRDVVSAVLKREHELTWVATLEEAQRTLIETNYKFELVLLDIEMPDGNGMDFLAGMNEQLVSRGIGTIFLTGTNTVVSRIRSFALGALDYIPKPFDIVEFQVRVNAKIKGQAAAERTAVQSMIRNGRLEIDLTRQQAFDLGEGETSRQLDLTPVEFRMLLLFLQNAGEVVPRQKILDTVWGQTAHVSARCVDHHVCGLRKKIASSGSRIESVYGVGYRIEA
jgi:DNA-binding response OmpR family regulator